MRNLINELLIIGLYNERLFYTGIAIIAASVIMTVLCIVIFSVTGQKLRKKLEQEYGKI